MCASILLGVKWNTGLASRFPFVTLKARSTTQSSWYWETTSFAAMSVYQGDGESDTF